MLEIYKLTPGTRLAGGWQVLNSSEPEVRSCDGTDQGTVRAGLSHRDGCHRLRLRHLLPALRDRGDRQHPRRRHQEKPAQWRSEGGES